jgi:hypothetical protein
MKTSLLSFLSLCLMLLSGCATPEYKAAYQECSPGAFSQYPEDKVRSFEMRQRWVQVPTGRVNCVTVQDAAHNKQTICTPITWMDSVMVMEPVVVDRNEEPRQRLIKACAQSLCVQRFGNEACKPATPAPMSAPTPTPAVEPTATTPP